MFHLLGMKVEIYLGVLAMAFDQGKFVGLVGMRRDGRIYTPLEPFWEALE